jgi:DNA-binding NarL/FixJ family response regulator
LSDREYQVFGLIAAGRTITDISDQLSLSVKTISTYRSRILTKLNLKTNADLARYAVQHRIVE